MKNQRRQISEDDAEIFKPCKESSFFFSSKSVCLSSVFHSHTKVLQNKQWWLWAVLQHQKKFAEGCYVFLYKWVWAGRRWQAVCFKRYEATWQTNAGEACSTAKGYVLNHILHGIVLRLKPTGLYFQSLPWGDVMNFYEWSWGTLCRVPLTELPEQIKCYWQEKIVVVSCSCQENCNCILHSV